MTTVARAAVEPVNIYVSPDGSDQFSGTLARNTRRGDGPVASVARARDLVRAMKQGNGGKLTHPVNIVLRGGTYWLPQPLVLTADDSGTAECPITYIAYERETPIVSAGRPVRGWDKATLNGHDVWAAKLPKLKDAQDAIGQMWVNGQRRLLARSPNKGFFVAGEVPDLTKQTKLQDGQTRFRFKPEDDLKNWPDVKDADIVLMSLWAESHLPVRAIDEQEHMIELTKATVHKMSPGDLYYIEGASELLDSPGEWYFNRGTATLYYMPLPGEGMIDAQVTIPWHEQIVRLQGAPEKGQFVEHVSFRGITFANSAWEIPHGASPIPGMKPGGFNQAAWGVPGAVWGEGVRDCLFQDCTIKCAGNYGLELGRGCVRNKISYCTFTDLGAGGIKIGQTKISKDEADQTKQNEISDCTIADCGQTYPSAIGIWLGQTPENLVSHNDIHGLWYTGISIGWTWGYGNSAPHDNVVEFNHVHHIGTPADGVGPVLSDMGAIYTLGKQPGTIIRNNHFHDIAGMRYGGWGIYFDEGSTGILAENNLVYRTTHGGFHQHYGENNIVRNNIFAFGRDAQIRRTKVEDHLSFTFERNLVYWNTGTLLDGNWSKMNVVFDHNTYWHVGGEDFKFGKLTWAEWRKAGMDEHSQIHDPGFIDPDHNDFHLKPGAEKDLLGFVPFDVSSAGPRPRK
ncbi:MAG TPA: right-handed parallel beta-helix repeat-containing protein [Tepidisphaeraceae bacterium]|nr:right-handed parallel beta-helix repeat-containing protein [Tepidisphaeraceae bacterium]